MIDRSGSTLDYEHRQYANDLWRYQLSTGVGAEHPDVIAASSRADRSGSCEIWVSDVAGRPRGASDLVERPALNLFN